MTEAETEYSIKRMTGFGTVLRGTTPPKNWKNAERKKKLVTSQCRLRFIPASFHAGDTVISPKDMERGILHPPDFGNSIAVAFHEL